VERISYGEEKYHRQWASTVTSKTYPHLRATREKGETIDIPEEIVGAK
jgi:hypothetical protein